VGEIVAFTNYLLTTMTPIMIMAMISHVVAHGMASAERLNEVLESTPEVQDSPGAFALPKNAAAKVVFENVCFHYNGASNETVLKDINLKAEPGETVAMDINLKAEPGETVAILGATGAGKSTLINLIPRFYDVSEGRVLIDGMDVRDLRQDSLISQVGIVAQETVLFSGTVRENIRYGHTDAPDEEVIAAAMNLSGGQKQRIAIARALITQPKILILDDSTSSVDVETETKIQDTLEEIMLHRTSFIVAQRISTVLNADKIVIIDKGCIVAQGTHTELMKSNSIYQEIYDSQLGNGSVLNNTAEADGVYKHA
jgi:ATP-binding cassette subfamily B protein